MAQTTPETPPAGLPRPLPRGGRAARSRDARPRFQTLDAAWMVLLVMLYAGLAFALSDSGTAAILAVTVLVALTYLLGWRASGRPAGVIAGLLLATSATFAASPVPLPPALFAAVTIAALFAFVAGSSLAALALAVVAVWLRPESILLGLMLLILSLVQKRQRAVLGAALFLVPTVAIWAYDLTTGRLNFTHALGFHAGLLAGVVSPATAFLSWFLLPFLGELGDPARRARWLPVLLWTGLLLILGTLLATGGGAAFLPLWFLLAGSGLARLLPLMTGEIPVPGLRYVVATLAVLALLAIRAAQEWPRRHAPAAPPIRQAAPAMTPISAAVAKAKGSKAQGEPTTPLRAALPTPVGAGEPRPALPFPPVSLHQTPVPVKTMKAAAKPAKPAVPLYVVKNGRLVKRSKWAIQWDLTHPQR